VTDPILIVDVQRGFLNEFTHHVPQRLRRLLEQGEHDPVLFTRFVNVKEGPYPTFLGWEAMQTAPDTDLAPGLESFAARGRVFEKRGLCGLPRELDAYLKREQPKRVYVAGIDTDMCVLKIALDLFDRSIEPVVLTDCCASTAGLQAHLAGLAVLSRNIGAARLRDAGLSDGTMAAPPPEDAAGQRDPEDAPQRPA
jgi:nicotinamidase-related amidase